MSTAAACPTLDRAKLGAARFRAAHEFPYFASALFALEPVACTSLPFATMAVDDRWRLYVDPGFLDDHPVEQLAGVLAHEVLHCIFDHGGRADDLNVTDHELWNLCGDAAINQILISNHGRSGNPIDLPGNPIFPSHLGFEPDQENLPADVMYRILHGEGRLNPGSEDDSLERGIHDCGSGSHGEHRSWEHVAEPGVRSGLDPIEAELARQRAALAIEEAVGLGAAVPAGLSRWATMLLRPKVDWRRELSGAVRHGLGATIGQVTPTWSRPSRRNQVTKPLLLPSMRRPVPSVGVVIDTSGSMTTEDLDAALGEVRGIVSRCGVRARNTRIWACDAQASEVTHGLGLADIELPGGGGTDMSLGIDAATTARGFHPDLVVVITDGYTPWPPGPPSVRIVIAVVADDPADIPDTPPWARTIVIPVGREAVPA